MSRESVLKDVKESLDAKVSEDMKDLQGALDQGYNDYPKFMALIEKHMYPFVRYDGDIEVNVALSGYPDRHYSNYFINIRRAERSIKVTEHLLNNPEDMPMALLNVESFCKKRKLPVLKREDRVMVRLVCTILLDGRHLTVPLKDVHERPLKVLKKYPIIQE